MNFKSMFSLATALLALSLGAAVSPLAAARGLTGPYRSFAIETMSTACVSAGANEPEIAKMPKAAVKDYCRCYAGRIADRATRAQIDAGTSPEVDAIAEEAAKVCFDAMPDAAKK